MTFRDRWSRVVRKSGSSTSTMASNDSSISSSTGGGSNNGSFLSRTFGLRSSKTSTRTASTSVSGYSDRGPGSRGSSSTKGVRTLPGAPSSSSSSNTHGSVGSTIDCPMAGQSKKCNKLPTLEDHDHDNDHEEHDHALSDDSGLRYSNMTESQRHQARLNAYRIKFGASQPWRGSFEEISPCNSRRVSMDMGP